jgi:hypothetical protein
MLSQPCWLNTDGGVVGPGAVSVDADPAEVDPLGAMS